MHKLLVHGQDILEHFLLPIGLYSEEGQESRHQDVKKYRLRHSRKTSRIHTLTDQFNRLLVTSDPVISSINKKHIHHKPFSPEILSLLDIEKSFVNDIQQEITPEHEASDSDSDSDALNSDDGDSSNDDIDITMPDHFYTDNETIQKSKFYRKIHKK